MCNYAEDELELTRTLYGSKIVHVKPDVLRVEVEGDDGETWIAKVYIENGQFQVIRDD